MMLSTCPNLPSIRIRRFAVGLLLLAVPACGLSNYEALMYKSQENEKRFREEQAYLDKPVDIPTRTVQTDQDREPREEPLANLFFRPPRGIDSKPQPEPRNNLLWQYRARSTGFDFSSVELAFADEDKNFADKVLISYGATEQPTRDTFQFTPPGQETPTIFDTWKFSNGQDGYSINILRSNRPIAIVYTYNKARQDSALKAIELSLRSLAIDQQVGAARQRYGQKTPWKLASKPGS